MITGMQPPRFNTKCKGYELVLDSSGKVLWPPLDELSWENVDESGTAQSPDTTTFKTWPNDFTAKYKRDIESLSAEKEVTFPISKKKMWFGRKSSADPDNELLDVVQYLEERYALLNITTRRQEFSWRGIPQANLIAVIPGSLSGRANLPVLMADHFDTAFAEDIFAQNGSRIAVPGADDNLSATATLLRAAEVI